MLAVVVLLIAVVAIVGGAEFYLRQNSSTTSSSSQTNQNSSSQTGGTTTTQQTTFSTVVLGGTAPSGYTFGNAIDGGLQSGMTWLNVSSGDQVSIRFTAPKSGTVEQIQIHGFPLAGSPRLDVGLEADQNGSPTGQYLGASDNFVEVAAHSQGSWLAANLTFPVQIQKGQVYHIVVSAPQNSTGVFAVTVYPGNNPYQPLNSTDPDINWRDNAINTLQSKNGVWSPQNKYPVFTLSLSDGDAIGDPYSLAAPWVVWGKTYVGQEVQPAMTYNVGKIAFVIAKLGSPKDNLYYAIYDSNNNVLVQGQFASPGDLTTLWIWRSVTLPHTVTFSAGHVYRIVLYSPNNDLQNAWQLIGFEFSSNYAAGYGGLQDTLTSSLDGGQTWGAWYDADCMFKLTTA